MNDALFVCGLQSGSDLRRIVQRRLDRHLCSVMTNDDVRMPKKEAKNLLLVVAVRGPKLSWLRLGRRPIRDVPTLPLGGALRR
jgi:hypothetical protein